MSLHTYTGGWRRRAESRIAGGEKEGRERKKNSKHACQQNESHTEKLNWILGAQTQEGTREQNQISMSTEGEQSSGMRDHWQFSDETGFQAVLLCPNMPRPKIQDPNQHNTADLECNAYVRNQYSITREIYHTASSRGRTWAIMASCGTAAHFSAIKMLSVLTEDGVPSVA